MKIAVFADNHGNPFATQAVLNDIAETGDFDAVVLAGDVCVGGSDPAGCVDMIQADDIQVVYGNADEFVFNLPEEPPDEIYRARWELTMQESRWAAEQLGIERLKWLKELPFERRYSPTDHARDELLVVHANPKNSYIHIGPPEDIQKKLFGSVHQADDDPDLLSLLEGVQVGIMAIGHFHYPSERYINGIRLVNVSPCSYSRFDSDRRARYTTFTWDGEWQVERKYVAYNLQLERDALLASDSPGKERTARNFE